MNISQRYALIVALLTLPQTIIASPPGGGREGAVIAFISDPHIQDVSGHPELVRSMEAQVTSTRLFNENIFAFRAALDDVAQRGIRLVVVDGDVTDDGQIVNQKAARDIMASYQERYGMRFFLTPGNHDPAAPYGKSSFVSTFLRADGTTHTVVSDSSIYAPGNEVNPLLYSVGHKEMVECYRDFGFMPRADYMYWATPFSSCTYEDYSYDKALEKSALDKRMFTYCDSLKAYDTSYVVEPIEGIWLLNIDSGVYLPSDKPKTRNNNSGYQGDGAGYNNTLQHKPYLIDWVASVCADAKRLGKRVIAFSHFPLLDFNRGASEPLARSWGSSKFDIDRVPNADVTRALFDAGVRLHFGGHMHVCDMAAVTYGDETMYNVQLPSLATCVPAYRIMEACGDTCRFETVVVDSVPGFDTFFDRYKKEYERGAAWSVEALGSQTYSELCDWQFRDLVRMRFAVRDLPKVLRERMLQEEWGMDMLTDFYRLHYSGRLAKRYIPQERLDAYSALFSRVEESTEQTEYMNQMRDFVRAFKCFLQDHEKDSIVIPVR